MGMSSTVATAPTVDSASSTPAQSAAAASFAGLVDKMDYLSAAEVEMVRQAYRFADAAHLGQASPGACFTLRFGQT